MKQTYIKPTAFIITIENATPLAGSYDKLSGSMQASPGISGSRLFSPSWQWEEAEETTDNDESDWDFGEED